MAKLEPFVGELFDGNRATLPLREKRKSFERLEMKQSGDGLNTQCHKWAKNIVRWPGLEAVECWAGPERPWPKSWDFNGGNELEATGQTNGERKESFWEILSCICFLLSPLIMGLNVCLHVYLWWFWDSTDATLAAEDTNSIPTLSHVWAVCSEFMQARCR